MSKIDDIEAALAHVVERLTAIEQKHHRLPAVFFAGVWRERHFDAGDVVQKAGALWIATRDAEPSDVPGLHTTSDEDEATSRSAWRLVSRRGRDGRDVDVRGLEARIKRLEQRL